VTDRGNSVTLLVKFKILIVRFGLVGCSLLKEEISVE